MGMAEFNTAASAYLNRNSHEPATVTRQDVWQEGKSWLKSLRANRTRASSNARQPVWAQPVAPSEEAQWLAYSNSSHASGHDWPSAHSEKARDDPAYHWDVWNYDEAMRQAIEASRLAFEDDAPSPTTDNDEELARVLRESTLTADQDESRRAEAQREEADLQAALRESLQVHKGKGVQPHRRSTTDEERQEIHQAMALSMREAQTSAGPIASSSAIVESPGPEIRSPPPAYVPPAPTRAVPPIPPRPAVANAAVPAAAAVAEEDDGSTTPTLESKPVLPARPPPPVPSETSNDSYFAGSSAAEASIAVAAPHSHQGSGSSTSVQHSSGSSRIPRISVTPPATSGHPHLSPNNSYRGQPSRGQSFGSDEASDFIAEFEGGNEWPLDPRGEELPYGGYRSKSPAQLSRLSEHTEMPTNPLGTPMSLSESNIALEAGDVGDAVPIRPPLQSVLPSQATQGSSEYVSAPESASDPSIEAAAVEASSHGPFGETLRFGYEADGEVQEMDGSHGVPGVIQFSTETVHDALDARRPAGVFAIEAPTWTTLVRGLMWYGNSRLESDRGAARGELSLASTFIGGTPYRAAHVRLSLSLLQPDVHGTSEQSVATPGRLRLPLPDRVLLPASLAEIAVSLYTLRHLAGIALSTTPGKSATTGYQSLRQLGTAIERLAQEHGEAGRTQQAEDTKMLRRLRQRLSRSNGK